MATTTLIALALLPLAYHYAEGCIGSGLCGGGGGCYSPPPVSCGGGCQQGYSCGSYGCARKRVRAHSSNTLSAYGGDYDKDMTGGATADGLLMPLNANNGNKRHYGSYRRKESKLQQMLTAERNAQIPRDPNQRFLQCCEERNLPDACLARCNFNTYTKESLISMYFRTDACPIEAAAEMQYCAALGRDHTPCCIQNQVHTTLAGHKCLIFCNQVPGNVTQLDFTYAGCYDKFEDMKKCFWYSSLQQ